MDWWEASPFTVAQMPFHGMSRYPYPASQHYPETPSADRYWLEWNSRFESGNREQRWDFDYRPAAEKPLQGPGISNQGLGISTSVETGSAKWD